MVSLPLPERHAGAFIAPRLKLPIVPLVILQRCDLGTIVARSRLS